MTSEADSSHNASTTQESSRRTQELSQTHRLTSAVWEHSHTVLNDENPAYRYCIHCTTDLIFKTKMASTNLQSHLKSKHAIIVGITLGQIQSKALDQLKKLYNQAELSDQIEKIDTQVFSRQLDSDVVNETLISLIVIQNLSFQAVEWPEFHVFCQVLNLQSKDIVTTAHSQVAKKIEKS